eukprot:16447101-Heterocapsa_arctica.AAC.1
MDGLRHPPDPQEVSHNQFVADMQLLATDEREILKHILALAKARTLKTIWDEETMDEDTRE